MTEPVFSEPGDWESVKNLPGSCPAEEITTVLGLQSHDGALQKEKKDFLWHLHNVIQKIDESDHDSQRKFKIFKRIVASEADIFWARRNPGRLPPEVLLWHLLKDVFADKYFVKELTDLIVKFTEKPYQIRRINLTDVPKNIPGAKRNIFIKRQMLASHKNKVSYPDFVDESQFYYWLDHSLAIQMIEGLGKVIESDLSDDPFACTLIFNTGILDLEKNVLYAVVGPNPDVRDDGTYPYTLNGLYNAEDCESQGILREDLPTASRDHPRYRAKMTIPRFPKSTEFEPIKWGKVKKFKSLNRQMSAVKKVSIHPLSLSLNIAGNLKKLEDTLDFNPSLFLYKRQESLNPEDRYDIIWTVVADLYGKDADNTAYYQQVGLGFSYDRYRDQFTLRQLYFDDAELRLKVALSGCKKVVNIPAYETNFKIGKRLADPIKLLMELNYINECQNMN